MADDQQLSAAAAELARRQSAAQIRGLVKLGELIDHLNDVAALAAQGHPQAKELARQSFARRQSAAQIRGLVKLGELIDHLNDVAALAAQGHPQAKELARQYLAAIDALRSAAAGIALVKGN